MNATNQARKPQEVPGPFGGPLGWLRDTFSFLILPGWKGYFRARQKQYGNVFKSHAIFKTIAVLDSVGFEPFVKWDGRLVKEYGFGWAKPPFPLVGNVTPGIFAEGNDHDARKQVYRSLLEARLGTLKSTFAAVSSEYFGRWEESLGPFKWKQQIERFYSDFFFQWLLGARPDPRMVFAVYNELFTHSLTWRVTQYIPFSGFNRQLRKYRRLVEFVKGSPGFKDVMEIANALGLTDEEDMARQLLFTIGVNCYMGLQSLTEGAVGELSVMPARQANLRAEARNALGRKPLLECSLRDLESMPELDRFLKEVLRLHPPVFYIFGKAERDFTLSTATADYLIRAGERLMGVIQVTQRDPKRYPNPDFFDSDRFKDDAAVKGLVWPHGPHSGTFTAQDRICAGRDFATIIAKLFITKLVLGYEWKLSEPGAQWNERNLLLNGAAPVGDMEVARFERLDGESIRWGPRPTEFDKLWNKVFEDFLFPWAIWIGKTCAAQHILKYNESVRRRLSGVAINLKVRQTPPRPYAYSLWTPGNAPTPPAKPFVSWTGLVDRRFTARHLPPAAVDFNERLPDIDKVAALFKREGKIHECRTSSALFAFFAQWFTDSFLRTSRVDSRCNTSNHEIDLCQIYGLDAETTALLRDDRATSLGKLRVSMVEGAEYPVQMFDENGRVRPPFDRLPQMQPEDPNDPHSNVVEKLFKSADMPQAEREARRRALYASGLERGNTTIVYSAINTIFIREHNRICEELHRAHRTWDNDRLFETARNINIVVLLRIIIEDYINHLADVPFKFVFDNTFASKKTWYRTNRISLEFDLLYRWHSQVPGTLDLNGKTCDETAYMYNNPMLESMTVERLLSEASRQSAGKIGIGNTPDFLMKAEKAALDLARRHRVRPFNEYCERFKMPAYKSFEKLVGADDPGMASMLRALYGHVDNVELMTGLFAENHRYGGSLPNLMRTMVAVDAFSHALTSPLLAEGVYNEQTFSKVGLDIIADSPTFESIVRRNCADGQDKDIFASFDNPETVAAKEKRRKKCHL